MKTLVAQKQGGLDDYQTPPSAISVLLPYLDPGWTIWEPAAGEGYLVRALEDARLKVIASDIRTGQDFLEYEPDEHYDVVVTNPPYQIETYMVMFICDVLETTVALTVSCPSSFPGDIQRITLGGNEVLRSCTT